MEKLRNTTYNTFCSYKKEKKSREIFDGKKVLEQKVHEGYWFHFSCMSQETESEKTRKLKEEEEGRGGLEFIFLN